jgi:hypothetical protein
MNLNPELNPNDKIVLVHMEGELFSPGTKGFVKSVVDDPFDAGGKIYEVKWEDGSTLSLLSVSDYWILADDVGTKITEDTNPETSMWLMDNTELFKYFDTKIILDFLLKLRESSVVNMFKSAPYLYMGKEKIAHEFYYNEPTNVEEFEAMLEMADEVQSIMISGVLRILDEKNMDYDESNINRLIKRFAEKMVQLYIKLH